MKIAVFGTPQIAADIFDELAKLTKVEIAVAVTTPDQPVGRGKKMTKTAVKAWAEAKNIPVLQPEKPSPELGEQLIQQGVELLVVISYGKIFSRIFLENSPTAWNLHFSLLPEFRGASPVPAAILAGNTVSGVSVFEIGPGLDDGPILGQKAVNIEGLRADRVFEKMHSAGVELLDSLLTRKADGHDLAKVIQTQENVSFCKKFSKQDGFLDPKSCTRTESLRKILAFYPWPGASVKWNNKRLKIHNAQIADKRLLAGDFAFADKKLCLGFSDGTLELTQVQPEGKRPMTGVDFARGQQWK